MSTQILTAWRVVDLGEGEYLILDGDGEVALVNRVDMVPKTGYRRRISKKKARELAQLLATAPELLESLKQMSALMDMLWKSVNWGRSAIADYAMLNEVPMQAKRVIAKATGVPA